MAATTTTKLAGVMLISFVVITLVSSLIPSVDAIKCHQCNSHSHEDCGHLIVNTPRAQRDDQYLIECKGEHASAAFCRKTVITFDVNDKKRIERSCGWMKESHHNTCFTADNEGYQQVICTCTGDGCNAAPGQLSSSNRVFIFLATSLSFITANWLRY